MKRRMTAEDIEYARDCIEHNDAHRFYCSARWQSTRELVMELDHHECVRCREVHHRICRASTVHHVHHLDEYPQMALEIWDEDGMRNLVSLCNSCHNEVHPEKQIKFKRILDAKAKVKPMNDERW